MVLPPSLTGMGYLGAGQGIRVGSEWGLPGGAHE